MKLDQKLRQLRGKLSQVEAAKKCGISQQQWSKLERGLIGVEETTVLPNIAVAFNVELAWLAGIQTDHSSTNRVFIGENSIAEPRTTYGSSPASELLPILEELHKKLPDKSWKALITLLKETARS